MKDPANLFELMKAIENCSEKRSQFISAYFSVPKPDGSTRFILNLKKFNRFVWTKHSLKHSFLIKRSESGGEFTRRGRNDV